MSYTPNITIATTALNTSNNLITRTTPQLLKMLPTNIFTSATILGSTLATTLADPPYYAGINSASPSFPAEPKCQEVNIFYTGFAAYHPYVANQNQNMKVTLEQIDIGLRKGAYDLLKAGYNVQVALQGPEQPLSNFETRFEGKHWDITAIGFGVRGYANDTATRRFEDTLYLYQRLAPDAPAVFNWGPASFAGTVIRRAPIMEDCTDKPGKLFAYEEICDPNVCEQTTNILDGDAEKLLDF
ncbi:hypothetical protein DE146DRAFT_655142 [Phaeosphaeria sp. MPI-PUGE-AT-0046c]|nr:hypothetical protein DE146DRAFT_655142 [Phaeosphaeria sp. MPI-PUGE-AT-0046c]